MAENSFGVDIDNPKINDMADYTAYITALELAGRNLPNQSDFEKSMSGLKETWVCSGLDPRFQDRNLYPVAKIQPKITEIAESLAKGVQFYLKRDIMSIKNNGGFDNRNLKSYTNLLYNLRKLLGIELTVSSEECFMKTIFGYIEKILRDPKIFETKFIENSLVTLSKLSVSNLLDQNKVKIN